ncbi:MAG: hexitol phosphatase HxpB [Flavobacteriia bacterium]|nr:hexitol phosphatase HxpB [Flavobacteriia bacterium]
MIFSITHYEAVIFDMDGVLIDSEPLWKIAMEQVFHSVGCKLTRQDFQKTVGLRIDEVIKYWYEHTGWENATPDEVERQIISRMVELIQENGAPLVGVLETLEFLKSNQIKIGLATSSYTILIHTVLETLKIRQYFDITHSAENEAYGKPHPAVYITVAELLKVNPSKCLVIEDSLNGIIAGKAAKMKVVCIPEKTHSPEPKLSLADFQFEDMQEMLNNLKQDLIEHID